MIFLVSWDFFRGKKRGNLDEMSKYGFFETKASRGEKSPTGFSQKKKGVSLFFWGGGGGTLKKDRNWRPLKLGCASSTCSFSCFFRKKSLALMKGKLWVFEIRLDIREDLDHFSFYLHFFFAKEKQRWDMEKEPQVVLDRHHHIRENSFFPLR